MDKLSQNCRLRVSCIVLHRLVISVKVPRTSAPYDIINLLYWIFIVSKEKKPPLVSLSRTALEGNRN